MTLAYDQLVQFDPVELDNVIPNLARSWEISDETTIVFHLHEARFHDGAAFTSEDVAASIERQMDPPEGVVSPRQGQFAAVSHVETPDDRTAVLRLHRPSAAIIPTLGILDVSVFAARDIHDDGFDHREQINGTGPFTLDRYDRGSVWRFSRYPEYFEEGLPYLDGFEYHIIPEEVARFAAFRGGQLDMSGVNATNAAVVENEMPEATLLSAPGTSYYTTVIATWLEPWTDPRTWEAIALAVSKQDANQAISEGRGFVGGPLTGSRWALPEEDLLRVPGYKGLGDGQEADMDRRRQEARQLLDAAGVASGTRVELLGRDGAAGFENWAVVTIDGLQHIGLEPNIQLIDRPSLDERMQTRNFTDLAVPSRTAVFADPTPAFADNYVTGGGLLSTGLTIPEVDDLFERQEQAFDPDERLELTHEMIRTYLGVYPAEIAHFIETRWALHNYVQGYGELYGSFYAGRGMQWVWLDN